MTMPLRLIWFNYALTIQSRLNSITTRSRLDSRLDLSTGSQSNRAYFFWLRFQNPSVIRLGQNALAHGYLSANFLSRSNHKRMPITNETARFERTAFSRHFKRFPMSVCNALYELSIWNSNRLEFFLIINVTRWRIHPRPADFFLLFMRLITSNGISSQKPGKQAAR